MIIDSMSKQEVMQTLRKEFDEEVLLYYNRKLKPQLKLLIPRRAKKEKQTINLGWKVFTTKNQTSFKILRRGNAEEDTPLFVCEFRWRNKQCFGNFFQCGNVVVYQSHCLQRYAERVLREDVDVARVFYNYLAKRQGAAFHIVLPTPTHEYSFYFGLANALFLGDVDVNNLNTNFVWCNTCISYNETKYSQSRITQTLHEIQSFTKKVNEQDLSKKENATLLVRYLNQYGQNDERINALKKFLIQKYLLWKLHLNLKLEITNLFKEEVTESIEYLESIMKRFSINYKSLSPYSKQSGVAWKGEIDYHKDSL